jgi:hypothetical protein
MQVRDQRVQTLNAERHGRAGCHRHGRYCDSRSIAQASAVGHVLRGRLALGISFATR